MKGIRRNLKKVTALVLIAFFVLAAYFVYAVDTYGGRWFTNPYNQRLQSARSGVVEGSILDRKGETLAYTDENGERKYNGDEQLRMAAAHVVGDRQGMTGAGAENFMAKYLLGFDQNLLVRVQQQLYGQSRRGSDVTLTIDAKLCKYIYQAMEGDGAAVLINYRTGELLASVSKPSFDPENIDKYAGDAASSALVNRATMGKYTPGSVFKLITASAALRYIKDADARKWDCGGPMVFSENTGEYLKNEHIPPDLDKLNRKAELESLNNATGSDVDTGGLPRGGDTSASAQGFTLLRDYGSDYHGELTLADAFAYSCNNTFGSVALEVGGQNMTKMAKAFGVGDDFMFDDIVLYDSSYQAGESDYQLAWSGVGQYKDVVTPVQMALAAAAVANDGAMMEPRLLYSVKSPGMGETLKLAPKVYSRPVTGEESDTLTSYMKKCVTYGTGKAAAVKGYTVCGKTGTAEVSADKTVGNHAWFIGFIDDDRHPVAIALVLEHAGSGGSKAAPVAGKLLAKAIELGY